MKTVLVAGGTGALGGGVLRELLDSGYPVAATWLVDRERELRSGLDRKWLAKIRGIAPTR